MKIFEVAGEGKLHGLTVMSLDKFVGREDDVEEAKNSAGPGWMLRADPKLSAAVKKNQAIARARQRSYGDPAAGKSFNDNPDDDWSAEFERRMKSGVKESDISGLMHASRNYNNSFIITAQTAEGETKRYRVKAQSERTAREKFAQHYNQAQIVDVKQEGLKEFAPPSGGDSGDEDMLRKLASKWWNGTEQEMAQAQRTLEMLGWEIGPDESGDDDAGVYVYRIGDDDGRDTVAFRHSELTEGQLDEIDRRGFLKGLGAAAMAGAAGGAKADWVNRGTKKDDFDDSEYGGWDNKSTDGTATLMLGNQRFGGQKDWNSYLHIRSNTGRWRPFVPHGHQGPVSGMWGRIRLDNGPVMNVHLGYSEGNNWTMLLITPENGRISDRNFIQSVANAERVRIEVPARSGDKFDREVLEFRKGKFESVEQVVAEAPGDFGLGANYRAIPDDEMQALMGRSKNKTKTKRDKFDYPYIHGSNIEVKDEAGKTFDTDKLKAAIMTRPERILGQNAKMQHSETGTEAIFDIGLPALKGLAVNEKTGEFVVVDTCPGAGACQTYCYAMKGSYVMFKAVSMGLARMLNFLLNDPAGFAAKLNAEIASARTKYAKKGARIVVRWHDAGDFFSPEYLDMAYKVAEANPDVGFYAYTKMGDVANAARPKNFNMNFSQGAKTGQEKKVNITRTKHSKVVPKDMFFDLIARKGNELIKDAKGRMQFASPENLEEFKTKLAQKYAIDRNSILTYDQMMKTPVGAEPKWNVIVMPGDGDNSANRNDVVGSYLLFH